MHMRVLIMERCASQVPAMPFHLMQSGVEGKKHRCSMCDVCMWVVGCKTCRGCFTLDSLQGVVCLVCNDILHHSKTPYTSTRYLALAPAQTGRRSCVWCVLWCMTFQWRCGQRRLRLTDGRA